MAASIAQNSTIPKFLLPRLTWMSKASYAPAASRCRPIHQPEYERLPRRTISSSSHTKSRSFASKRTWSRQLASKTPLMQRQSRNFTTAQILTLEHHFDTLKFVKRLQSEGFSEDQCVALMRILSDVIEESIQNLTRTMVLREDALKSSYTQKVDFSRLRAELLALDSADSELTRSSHERLTNELAKLSSRMRDEIQRTQASVRLDVNLERGRVREETNVQDLKIKETETRIEQEVAGLRERVEAVKFSSLQWLMGVCTGTAALILGAWRLLM